MSKRVRAPRRSVTKTPAPPTTTAPPKDRCGAQLRKRPGRYCRNPLGFKTPHPGQGRCWLHGGLSPIKHGRYSSLTHARLKDLMAQLERQDAQTMDLEPEARLLRAMVIDYVNRYDGFVDALMGWYDAVDRERREESLPPIPRRIPELETAADLVERISRIVERMHKISREGSITLPMFRSLLQQIGMVVAAEVDDPDKLERIEQGWMKLMVDPQAFFRDDTTPQDVAGLTPTPNTDDEED